ASTGVDPLATLVIEHVIAIAYCGELLDDRPRVGVEHEQADGKAGYNKQPVVVLIQRHRIIGECHPSLPGRNDCAFLPIENDDLARLRKVYVNPRAIFLKLE